MIAMPWSLAVNGNICTVIKPARTVKPVTEIIRVKVAKNCLLNRYLSRLTIITSKIKHSTNATILCASAKPMTPYAPGFDKLYAKNMLNVIVNNDTYKGVLVSLCA